MWKCNLCNETIDDDTWETCWKCSAPRSTTPEAADELRAKLESRRKAFQNCLRCDSIMQYSGTRQFHEGAKLGFWMGNLGELFVNRESFVIYHCPTCGKVEFYIDGIGNDFRNDPLESAP